LNDSNSKQTTLKRRALSWVMQLIIFISIFYTISWWQQKDMLSIGNPLTNKSFSLLSSKGQVIHYRFDNGEKDTLLYFFAPWCGVCHASIDNLEEIYQSRPDDLNIFIIALDWGSIEEIDAFLAQHQLTMPVLLGTREVQQNFKISAFPSYYLISRKAEIQSKNRGYSTELGMALRLKFNR